MGIPEQHFINGTAWLSQSIIWWRETHASKRFTVTLEQAAHIRSVSRTITSQLSFETLTRKVVKCLTELSLLPRAKVFELSCTSRAIVYYTWVCYKFLTTDFTSSEKITLLDATSGIEKDVDSLGTLAVRDFSIAVFIFHVSLPLSNETFHLFKCLNWFLQKIINWK